MNTNDGKIATVAITNREEDNEVVDGEIEEVATTEENKE